MNRLVKTLGSPRIRLGLMAAALVLLAPVAARADVERIREKALELEQKLNKEAFEADAKVATPASARVYKDFDFLLKKSKVDEVAAEAKTDPRAEALRLWLIQATVRSGIATYEDDLRTYEQTTTVDYDGQKVRYFDLVSRLAVTPDAAERRKIYSALSPLFDTSTVFRTEILSRRNETYQKWGFKTFADFYAAREGLDLDAVAASADGFLKDTQAAYDSLFSLMADRVLSTEARKVRFYDLPYLTQGADFAAAFPSSGRITRIRNIYAGLGVKLADESGLLIDDVARPGKNPATRVYALQVPSEVRISFDPQDGVRKDDQMAYAAGRPRPSPSPPRPPSSPPTCPTRRPRPPSPSCPGS